MLRSLCLLGGKLLSKRLIRKLVTNIPTFLASVNLALSFARRGIRTGILDTDIFGPSIPTLLNLAGEPRLDERKQPLISLCVAFN